MQKRTSYEFEGKCGYTYVCKAYGSSDVKFEVHFRASENDVDTLHYGVDENTARSMLRSLTRAIMESNRELGIVCLSDIIEEHQDKLEKSAESED